MAKMQKIRPRGEKKSKISFRRFKKYIKNSNSIKIGYFNHESNRFEGIDDPKVVHKSPVIRDFLEYSRVEPVVTIGGIRGLPLRRSLKTLSIELITLGYLREFLASGKKIRFFNELRGCKIF